MTPDSLRPAGTAESPPETYVAHTIAMGVRSSAERTPAKIALAEGTRQLSYRALVENMDRVANAAEGLNLSPGDHVALISPNCLEFIEIVLGLSSIGLGVVLVNPRLTAPEIEYICADSQVRTIFVHETLEDLIAGCDVPSSDRTIVIGRDYDGWRQAGRPRPPRIRLNEWDVFALSYTAGTTGKPKGVMLSHRSRALTFYAMAVEYGCYSPDDRSLVLAPLFHGGGFAFGLAPIFFGGFSEILSKFDPETVLRKFDELSITNTFMVPTHFNAIFALGAKTLGQYQAPSLHTIISNAAPLPQATKEKIVDHFGEGRLHETYGSTEGGIVTNLRPPDQLRKTRCVGQPFPCTFVKLLDEAGQEVPDGEVGELHSYSPFLFNGYWGMPEATADSLKEGWLSVGDMARKDEEGYYYIVDRKKDVIISGGVNIYPREIEEVLHTHPAVAEAAVIGIEDDYWGEAAKAIVSLRAGEAATADEIIDFCRTSLAGYKIPKIVSFTEALPRNAAGKVLKRDLRAGKAGA
ncbi:MAG: AMP-binding protein [Alphaproteobacteria bacterium]